MLYDSYKTVINVIWYIILLYNSHITVKYTVIYNCYITVTWQLYNSYISVTVI